MTGSCISYVSLPDDLDDFEAMLTGNAPLSDHGLWATDLDWLLAAADGHFADVGWTAPKGFPGGGVLFVYHTSGAAGRARKLERVVASSGSSGRLRAEVGHAALLARLYAGTIFAAARTADVSESDGDGYGAPLERVHIFPEPLPKASFEDVAPITTGSVRRLDGEQFDEIHARLSGTNSLPNFLARI